MLVRLMNKVLEALALFLKGNNILIGIKRLSLIRVQEILIGDLKLKKFKRIQRI